MASTTRTLTVNVVGRTKNVEKAFKRVSKGSALMSDKMMRATRMAGIGFTALAGVAIGAAAALKPMIDKAASMEESLSKNNVVFGESAAAVEAFAATSLHAFGVTERAALEATGVIGTLGSALGMTEADSASMATTLVGLAGDMSSFNDASVEETLTAIQAGLRGESEPLRRFGVLLDAATLKAKALEKGIITSTKEALTPQTKALAAYELILEQTSIQMGDFTRTADSATNQSKLLAGEWDKIQTTIGTALLPMFTAIVTSLNEEVMPALQAFADDPSIYTAGGVAGAAFAAGFGDGAEADVGDNLTAALTDVAAVGGPFRQQSIGQGASASVSWWQAFFAGWRNVDIDREMRDLEAAFESAGAAAFDRPPDVRDGGGGGGGVTPVTDIFTAVAALEAAAEAAAAAVASTGAEPFPGLSEAEIDAMVSNAAAAAVAAALEAVAAAAAPAAAAAGSGITLSQLTGGDGAADAADGPTDAEVLAWLGSPGAQALLGVGPGVAQLTSGGTTINITAAAVTGQELVDELGKYIDLNGPLGPQFISQ